MEILSWSSPELGLISIWLSKINVETLKHPIKQFPFSYLGYVWDRAQACHACFGYYLAYLSYSHH